MKTIYVVAAIISFESKILCVQRGASKFAYISHKYEFPGGKIEPGESAGDALIREIREELQAEIQLDGLLMTVNHQYPDFRIILHAYLCRAISNQITLTEHINSQWLTISEMSTLDWAEADMPIVKKLRESGIFK